MTNRRDGTQPRIPRLSYRYESSTASISDQSVITVGTDSSAASISTCASSPPASSFGGSPRSFRFPEGALSPLSLDGASDTKPSSSFLSPQTAKDPKKKSSSILKFFSVKEPSTQAFEAYQEQMKKRGTTQSGRANAVGLQGVSSQRLPPTVPKVNSKWDGVPQTVKDKAKEKDTTHRQSFASASRSVHTSQSYASNLTTSSTSSSSSTRSGLRVNGKLRLDNSSGNLADIYGWETGTQSSSSSTRSLPLEQRPSPSRESSISFFNRPPLTIPEAGFEPSATTPPPLDPSSNRPSPAIAPSLQMPLTPTDSVPALPLSLPQEGPQIHLTQKEHCAKSMAPICLTSSGANVLGPPASATIRKAKPALFLTGEASELRLPSRDSNHETLHQPSSILKRPAWGSSRTLLVGTPGAEGGLSPGGTKSKRAHVMSLFGKDSST
ncbi:MAG: hypothetical protein Q9218_003069 [Villophora microphyllina]